jgi:hypothetical protein
MGLKLCENTRKHQYLYIVVALKVPGRVALGITTTLSLVSMSNGVFNNAPKTSYLKSIDVWILACISFTFSVLCELCFVIHLEKTQREKQVIEFYFFLKRNVAYRLQSLLRHKLV